MGHNLGRSLSLFGSVRRACREREPREKLGRAKSFVGQKALFSPPGFRPPQIKLSEMGTTLSLEWSSYNYFYSTRNEMLVHRKVTFQRKTRRYHCIDLNSDLSWGMGRWNVLPKKTTQWPSYRARPWPEPWQLDPETSLWTIRSLLIPISG